MEDSVINQGSTFLVANRFGDIAGKPERGLIYKDTRHISFYQLTINEDLPELLTAMDTNFHRANFILTNKHSGNLPSGALTIVRKRSLKKDLNEEIEFTNNTGEKINFTPILSIRVDFADIFEVTACRNKAFDECEELIKKRDVKVEINSDRKCIIFSYQREGFKRETRFTFNHSFKTNDEFIIFDLTLQPKEIRKLHIHAEFCSDISNNEIHEDRDLKEEDWNWSIPNLETNWHDLQQVYIQSVKDLTSLRIHERQGLNDEVHLPAAGRPWFMTVFGRDSLITSFQTLIFGQRLARGTIRMLARYQGRQVDQANDEEPGKIVHEMRFGEHAYFSQWVTFPYYGTVDATPLFLILLYELFLWSGNEGFVNKMKEKALAALEWIDRYGDMDGDGFVEYERKNPKGLENQNWRDSWDSMTFKNGELAEPPIASADVQGYVYQAKLSIAKIARNVWEDENLASRLEKEARELKDRFNKAFWVEEEGYFALGLDKNKNHIDSLSSSIGHLLWSGIVDEDKINRTIETLFSEDLYSGWGIRTLSKKSKRYNPIGYHLGTVWPHDNSLVAFGLYKQGEREKAVNLIKDMIKASSFFDYRLPEVFAGFDKSFAPFPIMYPTACSPQAWASGTPILSLRMMLGLEPDIETRSLKINPFLPDGVNYLILDGVAAFGKHFKIVVNREEARIAEVEEWICGLCKKKVNKYHKH